MGYQTLIRGAVYINLLLVRIAIVHCQHTGGSSYDAHVQLYLDKITSRDANSRPALSQSEQLIVYTRFHLNDILAINEVDQTVDMVNQRL